MRARVQLGHKRLPSAAVGCTTMESGHTSESWLVTGAPAGTMSQEHEQRSQKHRPPRGSSAPREAAPALFPPELISEIRRLVQDHPAIVGVSDAVLAELLTVVFFGSLEAEELEHHPIRVAFLGDQSPASIPEVRTAADAAGYRWRALSFQTLLPCDTRHLRRLARAALSEHVFAMVARVDGKLRISGMARAGFRLLDDPMLTMVAPRPGCLEIWWGPQRVLEYVRGRIVQPPENVLLAAGPVRRMLMSFAAATGVLTGYLTSVAGLVRHVAAHAHGGILVVSGEDAPQLPGGSGIPVDPSISICGLLRELSQIDVSSGPTVGPGSLMQGASVRVLRSALRTEIDRVVADIAGLTALDGATLLDRALGVRGFGTILGVDPGVGVVEALDAEGTRCVPFPLGQHGARHRAAASYALAHPASVVFVVSADGDVGCMLGEVGSKHVRLWRFRPTEVRLT